MEVKSDTSFLPRGMTEWEDIHRSCGYSHGHIDLYRAGHVARMWEKINAYSVKVRKTKGWRLLGRPGHQREDDIKIVFRGVDWICVQK
jgi:hypothetical protein